MDSSNRETHGMSADFLAATEGEKDTWNVGT